MKNKIAIIGAGTAGSITSTLISQNLPHEVDWYFDPNTPAKSVGEGTSLTFPKFLYEELNVNMVELNSSLDGTYKNGIRKINWGGSGDFIHDFPLGASGVHFNASKFQNLTQNKIQDRVNIIPSRINSYEDIDATYIIDCSGKPLSTQDYTYPKSIPVNSTHIVQCFWEKPEFEYTLTIARPYGWVFGIPLQNRCSIGYLYNKNINTLEEVQEDIKEVFKQFNLTPSSKTNSFSFDNYFRKQNFYDRVAYNGNASFFLEPLEATSIDVIIRNTHLSIDFLRGESTLGEVNIKYQDHLNEIEEMIMLHYLAGSKFNTPFWKFAQERAQITLEKSLNNSRFTRMFNSLPHSPEIPYSFNNGSNLGAGTWPINSYYFNLKELGLLQPLSQAVFEYSRKNCKFI